MEADTGKYPYDVNVGAFELMIQVYVWGGGGGGRRRHDLCLVAWTGRWCALSQLRGGERGGSARWGAWGEGTAHVVRSAAIHRPSGDSHLACNPCGSGRISM